MEIVLVIKKGHINMRAIVFSKKLVGNRFNLPTVFKSLVDFYVYILIIMSNDSKLDILNNLKLKYL